MVVVKASSFKSFDIFARFWYYKHREEYSFRAVTQLRTTSLITNH